MVTYIKFKKQGSQTTKTKPYETCTLFKKGEKFNRNDAERLFRHLVLQHVLGEELVIGAHDNVISYLKCGPRANEVICNKQKVYEIIFNDTVQWNPVKTLFCPKVFCLLLLTYPLL